LIDSLEDYNMAVIRRPGAAISALESTTLGGDQRLIRSTPQTFHSALTSVLSTDNVGSTYPLAEIPLQAILLNVWLSIQNGGTGTTQLDLGFYKTARDGSTLIARDVLTASFSLATQQDRISGINAVQYPVSTKEGIPLWKILFPSATRLEDTKLISVNLTATLKSDATGSGSFVAVGQYVL
jgi:hypothetical protein